MKKILPLLLISIFYIEINAQDIPIILNYYNNNTFFNPSVVGLNSSNYTFSYKRRWHNFSDVYNNLYLGGEFSIPEKNLGFGLNINNEKIDLFKNIEVSGSVAYHIIIKDGLVWSLGLKTAYTENTFDVGNIEVLNPNDPLLMNYTSSKKLDFSFGTNLTNSIFDIGFSYNRLLSSLSKESEGISPNVVFPGFFTLNGSLRSAPIFEEIHHLVEGRFNFRTIPNSKNILDAGVYYTYNNMFTLGANYRSTNAFILIAGFTYKNRYIISYAHEVFSGKDLYQNLPSEEILLRYQFDETESFLYPNNFNRKSSSRVMNRRNYPGLKQRNKRNKIKGKKSINNPSQKRKMRNYKGKYKKLRPRN